MLNPADARSWEDLARAEERWRLSFESSPLGVAVLSLSGQVLRVNRALCVLVGYDRDTLHQMTSLELSHPDDTAISLDRVQACLNGEISSYRLQKRYLHARGHAVPVEVSVALVREPDGVPVQFIVHVEDLTERRQIENDLRHFAAVASHDLRTPLASISGYLELVREGPLDEQQTLFLERAMHAADRMNGLLAMMLAHTRHEGTSPDLRVIDVPGLLDDVLGDLASALPWGSVVRRDLEESVLLADETELRQLVSNLLGNAMKYCRTSVPLEIDIDLRRVDGGLLLSVGDNGQGIPDNARERIFDMFYRQRPDEPGGHGIGLATCRRIMQRHRGRIWAEPAPSGGTVMCCFFPD